MPKNYRLLLILGTLICAFCMPVFARWKREICAPLATVTVSLAFAVSLLFGYRVLNGEVIRYYAGGWPPPWGIEIIIEPLSSLMLILITGICLLILIYSYRSLQHEIKNTSIGWYYTEYILCMAAMMGLVITNDVFNMFVFIEVTGISACALVVAKGEQKATEAALKYLLMASIGSGFVLFGIGLLYMITGNLNMIYASTELHRAAGSYPALLLTIISFFVVGFGIKSALFPLHLWLPDAHSAAPSPSSAVLSSLVVKVYIVALLKLFFIVFNIDIIEHTNINDLLVFLAAVAMIAGSFFAFVQLEIKRRLAYSTVAQIGYIFLGVALGTPWVLAAGILHIIVHALMKTCLFFTAGAIYYQTGKKHVNELCGLHFQMPVTMACFTVASLSMVGIPLFGGFITKYGLAMGSLEAGRPYLVVLIVFSGLLNAMYYFPIIWQAYFCQDEAAGKKVQLRRDRLPLTMLVPMALLAAGVIILGVFPSSVFAFITLIVERFLPFSDTVLFF